MNDEIGKGARLAFMEMLQVAGTDCDVGGAKRKAINSRVRKRAMSYSSSRTNSGSKSETGFGRSPLNLPSTL
jgi:hypothetical protein